MTRNLARLCSALALVLVVAAGPVPALAQSSPPTETAAPSPAGEATANPVPADAAPAAPPPADPAPAAVEAPQATPAPATPPPSDTGPSPATPAKDEPAATPPAEPKADTTAQNPPDNSPPPENKPAPPAEPAYTGPTLLGKPIRSWGYQLQNDKVEEIAASPYDVIVMDYSRESSQSAAFTPDELAKMKVKPDGSRRIVLSYISIGEAESYRYYWQEKGWSKKSNRPKWIGAENPEWKGNYSVKFWEEGWQDIILHDDDSYLNRIMKAGFDGVYLDKIDIAFDLQGKSPKGTDAIDLMIDFVITLSETMKAKNPNFLIFPQNAEGLLSNAEYRRAVDGIGKEDLLYREEEIGGRYKDGYPNPAGEVDESVGLLKQLQADGRTILVVEYLHSNSDIKAAAKKHAGWGFISYFGPRDLGRLVPISEQPVVSAAAQRKPTEVAATCSGLTEDACTENKGCTWLPGYEASPGTEIPGQCRDQPRSVAPRHRAAPTLAAGAQTKSLSSRLKGLRMRGSDERGEPKPDDGE